MDKPRTVINKVERINGILRSAKEARQQLRNLAAALVELHDCDEDTSDAAELSFCVTEGHDYQATLRRIMNNKLQRYAAEEIDNNPTVETFSRGY
jgi:hypothetical protein